MNDRLLVVTLANTKYWLICHIFKRFYIKTLFPYTFQYSFSEMQLYQTVMQVQYLKKCVSVGFISLLTVSSYILDESMDVTMNNFLSMSL